MQDAFTQLCLAGFGWVIGDNVLAAEVSHPTAREVQQVAQRLHTRLGGANVPELIAWRQGWRDANGWAIPNISPYYNHVVKYLRYFLHMPAEDATLHLLFGTLGIIAGDPLYTSIEYAGRPATALAAFIKAFHLAQAEEELERATVIQLGQVHTAIDRVNPQADTTVQCLIDTGVGMVTMSRPAAQLLHQAVNGEISRSHTAAEPAGPTAPATTAAAAVPAAQPAHVEQHSCQTLPPATPAVPNQGTRTFLRRLQLHSHQLDGLVEDVVDEDPVPEVATHQQVECQGGWGNLAIPTPSPVPPQEAVQPHIVADPSA
jgi:hypothetical protein